MMKSQEGKIERPESVRMGHTRMGEKINCIYRRKKKKKGFF